MFDSDKPICQFSGTCPFQYPRNFSVADQELIEKFVKNFGVPYHEVLTFLLGVERKNVK